MIDWIWQEPLIKTQQIEMFHPKYSQIATDSWIDPPTDFSGYWVHPLSKPQSCEGGKLVGDLEINSLSEAGLVFEECLDVKFCPEDQNLTSISPDKF